MKIGEYIEPIGMSERERYYASLWERVFESELLRSKLCSRSEAAKEAKSAADVAVKGLLEASELFTPEDLRKSSFKNA
jgi:hypothetical protein